MDDLVFVSPQIFSVSGFNYLTNGVVIKFLNCTILSQPQVNRTKFVAMKQSVLGHRGHTVAIVLL